MQFPDASAVLGQTADPPDQHGPVHGRTREPLRQNRGDFLARQFERRPASRLAELLDEQRRRLLTNRVWLGGEIGDLHGYACPVRGIEISEGRPEGLRYALREVTAPAELVIPSTFPRRTPHDHDRCSTGRCEEDAGHRSL